MISQSVFEHEIEMLEDWYETSISRNQKDKFYRAIKSTLTDKEFQQGCLRVCRNNHFFPLPTQIIESAGEHIVNQWNLREMP